MILRKIKMACLLSVMTIGVMSTTLPAMTMNCIVQNQESEKEWTLLETKDGVSCYYINGPLGTCNNAVQLRFVNSSATDVTVNFSVETDGVAIAKKVVVAAGQTIDSYSDSSLSIRPVSSGKPVVSFTVSK